MSNANSFVIERPLEEGDLFVGRFSELLAAAQHVKRGKLLLLVFGARHSGATSFLNHLQAELRPTTQVLRVEVTGGSGDAEQTLALVTAALEQTQAPQSQDLEHAGAQGQTEQLPQRCVVMLDALPVAALRGDRGSEWVAAVHAYLQNRSWLQLVVAVRGCRPSGGALSPNAAALPALELKGLTLEQTEQLLTSGAGDGLRFEFDAMRRVWQVTSGNPYLVQLFGRVLGERHSGRARITAHAVEQVVPVALERAAGVMESLWTDCSVAAQATLAVSNELPGRHGTFTRNDVIAAARQHSANLKESVAEAALDELEMLGILEKLGRGTYRHTIELFRLWEAQKRPLDQLLGRGREYRGVLGERGSPLDRFTWRTALGWGGLLVALLFFVVLWNSRQPPISAPGREIPTGTASSATRPPVLPGASQGWITYMAKPNPDAAWDVWLMRGDGSDPKRLTSDGANNQTPCWSPDGRLIAFVSDRDGNKEVYTVKADGTTPLNLTHNPAEDWTPAWSPDGTTIAFSSYRDGNWEIYLMDANGANPRRLTHNSAADYAPSWSPDGQRIAFQSNRDGNWEIYVIGSDGKGTLRLTNDEATDSAPAWSPDGERIAFESYRDGNMEIYIMAADGSGAQNLTQDEYSNEHGPTWARAGTRILYYSNRDGGWDIYSMKLDGTDKENLTLNPALEQRPNWHE